MDTVKIGGYIAFCRKRKGMTQQQLAEELGITNKAVSKWETGQGMPDITLLPLLATVLNTTTDDILSGEKKVGEQKTDNELMKNINENIVDYQKQKLFIFKTASKFSLFFSLIGIIIPHFIELETNDYTGVLFGIWLQLCSFSIFFIVFKYIKAGIQQSTIMMELTTHRLIYLRFLRVTWSIMPTYLLISLICNAFQTEFVFRLIGTVVVVVCVNGVILYRELVKK